MLFIQVWNYQVELSKLNPDKAYIQITFAEPYFDNYGEYNTAQLGLLLEEVTVERSHNDALSCWVLGKWFAPIVVTMSPRNWSWATPRRKFKGEHDWKVYSTKRSDKQKLLIIAKLAVMTYVVQIELYTASSFQLSSYTAIEKLLHKLNWILSLELGELPMAEYEKKLNVKR